MSLLVAIDGPAASGKGTIARRVAARFGLAHLDTGLLYRAVAAKMLAMGLDLTDEAAAEEIAQDLTQEDLHRADLRGGDTARAASEVAALPSVRAALLDYQRWFARNPLGGMRGAVLDGRDIGTVICPDADVKLFITASAAERARRRCLELASSGKEAEYERVLAEVMARDKRDSERSDAPLRPAEDALLLDTTDLAIDQAVAAAVALIQRHAAV